MRNAYRAKTIGGGTTYGKQDEGSVSKVPLMGNRESAVLRIFMKY